MDRTKPLIIEGVDITQQFSAEDILGMFKNGRLRAITDRGYCTQGTEEGTLQFVPFWESVAFRSPKTYYSDDFVDVMREDVEHEHPILRRTPQERVAAMALRVLAEVKRTGRITGLSDEEHAAILGESWRSGEPLTGDDIQKLSAWFMQRAEVDNKEADSHRVTRDFMTA